MIINPVRDEHESVIDKSAGTDEPQFSIDVEEQAEERREYRRHDMEEQDVQIQRFDGVRQAYALGRIIDLSCGGVRLRTTQQNLRPDQHIRVRLELPDYAGIYPFVDTSGQEPQPRRDWVGWMSITRVIPVNDRESDVAGRLVDMHEFDRGMLGLYLSTQPMAA
jgi:hypothetical protein